MNTLQGDSGGPVVKDGEIIGIISFCKLCATEVADVHTNVYLYMDFITSILEKHL
jgi:secreted trypsin-like serine protease